MTNSPCQSDGALIRKILYSLKFRILFPLYPEFEVCHYFVRLSTFFYLITPSITLSFIWLLCSLWLKVSMTTNLIPFANPLKQNLDNIKRFQYEVGFGKYRKSYKTNWSFYNRFQNNRGYTTCYLAIVI